MSTPLKSLRSISELVAAGILTPQGAASAETVAARYAVAITPAMHALMSDGPADPIARQFVPSPLELIQTPEERADPIGDDAHSPLPGLVHRYPDRVLLKVVHVCPVYCRFCFRRETVGPKGNATGMESRTPIDLARAAIYIAERPDIWEVILTGGDPFMLAPRRAAEVTASLAAIPHVKILRWHTRVPVVDPDRVTPAFAQSLRSADATTYVAIHANHPRELTRDALTALERLADAGVVLVSQTVLLRGVNDDAGVLAELMRAFVAARVKPYYLHHPDLAPGTSHFRVSLDEGQSLMRALRGRLSGLCQPTYVLDVPGGFGKVPVGPSYIADGRWPDSARYVEDPDGGRHPYPPEPTDE